MSHLSSVSQSWEIIPLVWQQAPYPILQFPVLYNHYFLCFLYCLGDQFPAKEGWISFLGPEAYWHVSHDGCAPTPYQLCGATASTTGDTYCMRQIDPHSEFHINLFFLSSCKAIFFSTVAEWTKTGPETHRAHSPWEGWRGSEEFHSF